MTETYWRAVAPVALPLTAEQMTKTVEAMLAASGFDVSKLEGSAGLLNLTLTFKEAEK
jgi:hypothetical protein